MKKLLSLFVLLSLLGMIIASVAIAYRENWDIPLMETLLECGIKYEVLDSPESPELLHENSLNQVSSFLGRPGFLF